MKIKAIEIEWLEKFTEALLHDFDPKSVEDKLQFLVGHYNLINTKILPRGPIWRAQNCKNEEGFSNAQRMGPPPPKYVETAGRLNDAGESIFYTSFHKETALEEIDAQADDYIQLASFKPKSETPIKGVIIGEYLRVFRSGKAKISDSLGTQMLKILSQLPFEVQQSVVYLDGFFSQILEDTKAEDSSYLHSRTLGKLLMTKLVDVDALFYPSILGKDSLNIALKPQAHSSLLIQDRCYVIKITKKYKYGIFSYEHIRTADGAFDDGVYVWK